MRNCIRAFRLANFQSWDAKDRSVTLGEDILNIIEAPNETGKSVLFKALYNMVFPGYWSPTELIRRGYSKAVMLLHLADGSIIAYTLERSHYSVTLIVGTEKKVWEDYREFPPRLTKLLGLIIDTNSKIILNIIDKDVPLPFIKTSPSFNASLIKAIVEPPEITEFFETLKSTMADVLSAKVAFGNKASQAYAAAQALSYCDTDVLAMRKQRVDAFIRVSEWFMPTYATLQKIADTIRAMPQAVGNPAAAEPGITTLDCLENTCTCLADLKSISCNLPVEPRNPMAVKSKLDLIDTLEQVLWCLADLKKCMSSIPIEPTCPDVSSGIDTMDAATECIQLMGEIITASNYCTEQKKQRSVVAAELQQMRDKFGVCPICGRLFEENCNEAGVHHS